MSAAFASAVHVAATTDTSLALTRAFAAPPRAVWEAMTTPALMQQWMLPPPGWTMTTCECDPRVAGVLRLVWKNDEAEERTALLGVFTDVIPYERFVHTEVMVRASGEIIDSQLETHEFTESRGGTQMRITQVCASKEARDIAVASGMERILEAGFVRLDALLARQRAEKNPA